VPGRLLVVAFAHLTVLQRRRGPIAKAAFQSRLANPGSPIANPRLANPESHKPDQISERTAIF
jgi:hypothetical protein